jgi:AcrR family transcriptional regulator
MRPAAKRKLNKDIIIREAAAICDEFGLEKLSLAALADRLGVRPPSLYNHIKSLEYVYSQMAIMGIQSWTESMRQAVDSSPPNQRVRALAHASREFAQQQPTLYYCATRQFANSSAEYLEAATPMIELTNAVYSDLIHDPQKEEIAQYLLRCLVAGFITLESNNGLQPAKDLDSLYDKLIDLATSAVAD